MLELEAEIQDKDRLAARMLELDAERHDKDRLAETQRQDKDRLAETQRQDKDRESHERIERLKLFGGGKGMCLVHSCLRIRSIFTHQMAPNRNRNRQSRNRNDQVGSINRSD